MARRKPKQPVQLALFRRGGARKGAGRKPKGKRPGVPHIRRPRLSKHHPAHVTVRLPRLLPSLRTKRAYECVRAAIHASTRADFQVVHHSVQQDHVHLICEADDATALANGVNGLCVRMARGLNRVWDREGPVFDSRHHVRVLASPVETHIALEYVLTNARKHGHRITLDPFSSAETFEGWDGIDFTDQAVTAGVMPRTWLLRNGWRQLGRLDPWGAPKDRRKAR
jgi:REP element-mobilizing transposase RayT